ncbi:MAG: hypothetical protein ACYTGV_16055 [Planctomycetota bacterium]|jgi:hypothetical protein
MECTNKMTASETLSITEWRGSRPELYQANCPGLHDPRGRQGHYLRAPYEWDSEERPITLWDALRQLAEAHPHERFFDLQPVGGRDADPGLCFHMEVRRTPEGTIHSNILLRRSVLVGKDWEPRDAGRIPYFEGNEDA